MKRIKITASGIECGCGQRVQGEYKAQDPAPCGCAWVWRNNNLFAIPSIFALAEKAIAETTVLTGQVTARCHRCGRPLTNPTSIAAGYGPVCRQTGP